MPKLCRVCQISKPVNQFKKNLMENQGRHHTCKECTKLTSKSSTIKYSSYMSDDEFELYCKSLKK